VFYINIVGRVSTCRLSVSTQFYFLLCVLHLIFNDVPGIMTDGNILVAREDYREDCILSYPPGLLMHTTPVN